MNNFVVKSSSLADMPNGKYLFVRAQKRSFVYEPPTSQGRGPLAQYYTNGKTRSNSSQRNTTKDWYMPLDYDLTETVGSLSKNLANLVDIITDDSSSPLVVVNSEVDKFREGLERISHLYSTNQVNGYVTPQVVEEAIDIMAPLNIDTIEVRFTYIEKGNYTDFSNKSRKKDYSYRSHVVRRVYVKGKSVTIDEFDQGDNPIIQQLGLMLSTNSTLDQVSLYKVETKVNPNTGETRSYLSSKRSVSFINDEDKLVPLSDVNKNQISGLEGSKSDYKAEALKDKLSAEGKKSKEVLDIFAALDFIED